MRTGGVAQVIECLPSKYEALSSASPVPHPKVIKIFHNESLKLWEGEKGLFMDFFLLMKLSHKSIVFPDHQDERGGITSFIPTL
jgi:hypothetical protein